MKKCFITLGMLAASVCASAQIDKDDKQLFNHIGAGVSVGLDGIGFNLATTITPYVQARAGISFMPKIQINDIDVDISDATDEAEGAIREGKAHLNTIIGSGLISDPRLQEVANKLNSLEVPQIPEEASLSAKLNMTDFKLLFDIYPTKTSPWRLTVGFYAGKSKFIDVWTTNLQTELGMLTDYNTTAKELNATRLLPEQLPIMGVELGDYLIEPNGTQATAYLKVNSFKPYIGIGSGRAISNKHRFSFAWDLGCQFWSTPTIYVMDKQLEESDIDGGGDIVKTISKITVYPTLSFRFNGRIL